MDKRKITGELVAQFEQKLREHERSEATIAKYRHDIQCFMTFANGACPNF